jgi:hypothetical protein
MQETPDIGKMRAFYRATQGNQGRNECPHYHATAAEAQHCADEFTRWIHAANPEAAPFHVEELAIRRNKIISKSEDDAEKLRLAYNKYTRQLQNLKATMDPENDDDRREYNSLRHKTQELAGKLHELGASKKGDRPFHYGDYLVWPLDNGSWAAVNPNGGKAVYANSIEEIKGKVGPQATLCPVCSSRA